MAGTTTTLGQLPSNDELRVIAQTIDPATGKLPTQRQIAERFGVTRQAVTKRLAALGPSENLGVREWPWKVRSEHKEGWIYECLSAWVRQQEGVLLDTARLSRLTQFMQELERLGRALGTEQRIDYDPAFEIGFYFRDVRRGDPKDSILGKPAT